MFPKLVLLLTSKTACISSSAKTFLYSIWAKFSYVKEQLSPFSEIHVILRMHCNVKMLRMALFTEWLRS